MDFLYFLEGLRMPWLDACVAAITHLGGEMVFLVVALVIFWCVDKRQGYYLLCVGFLSTLVNQFLKIICRIPRPWVRDPHFTIVEAAREAATGYSFPSGHSTSSVATFGVLATETRHSWLRKIAIALCVLIPLSRLYLGVHTPADVLVGSAISLFFIILLRPVVYGRDGRHLPKLLALMLVLAAAFVGYMEFFPFPANVDPDNLHHALENSYTLLGALLGMIAVWYADRKLNFPTDAVWYAQILKTVLGFALALVVKEGLKVPLDILFAGHTAARALRYCLLVLFVGIVWPLTFPRFSRLGRKETAQ